LKWSFVLDLQAGWGWLVSKGMEERGLDFEWKLQPCTMKHYGP